jgi:uncharacterized membrane protein
VGVVIEAQDGREPQRSARSRFTGTHPAVLLLAAFAATWTVTFAILVVRRHDGFWDFDFDMGLYDQAVWLLAHGHEMITVRGLPVFGHHAHVGFFLLVPFSWLGAGPNFLNVLQVVVLGLAPIPLSLLARERRLGPWPAAALGAVLLLHPATQFVSWELFHPETIAVTPLLCAYLCSVRRSWRWFACWAVLAICWKEDIALAVVVMGLLIAWRGDRKVGLLTAGVALGWLVFVSQVLLPLVSGHPAHYGELYQGVGGSAGGALRTLLSDPGEITGRIVSSESGDFAWHVLAPFGLAPLLGLGPLTIGLPHFVSDVLSDVVWTRVITFRYVTVPLVAAALATVDVVGGLSRRAGVATARGATAMVLVAASVTAVAWGPSPIGADYDNGLWPPVVNPRLTSQRRAVALVPDDASVSASYGYVSHLTHRPEIYTFPNPWRRSNYGVKDTETPDPARIDWLVIFAGILASGDFRVVSEVDGIVVARRVRPGSTRAGSTRPG